MIIQVDNLSKVYRTYKRGHSFKDITFSIFKRSPVFVNAVNNISFQIKRGELIGYIGPNGAGKSTTLKMLTGVLFPTSGNVSILGFTPWKQRKKYVANIGAIFGQKSQLIWDIPPVDAFHMNKAIYSISTTDFQKRKDEMVEMLDAEELIHKPTRQLSLGERMKCEFIMAMLHNPRIVFLDEPTIGLDIMAKEKIREFILEQNKRGVTFILTTHDLDDIERLAKRVIMINHGQIAFDGSMNSLKSHLGRRKIVRISANREISDIRFENSSHFKRLSPFDVEFELDLKQTGINNFIKQISEKIDIKDISIQEIPIERIVKELYKTR